MPDREALKIEYVPLSRLMPFGGNPRSISNEALKRLGKSLADFGVVDPIIVQRGTDMVIGGHQRLKAAQLAGMAEVPVVYLDIADDKAKALNIALNNPALQGEWDEPKLGLLLEELRIAGMVDQTGFAEEEIDMLLADLASREFRDKEEDFDVEAAVEPRIKRGEVWGLGRHRLMCGDTRIYDDVRRLVGTELVDAIITSPPYPGVGLWDTLWPGMSLEECHEWLGRAYGVWREFSAGECNWIINTADNTDNQWNDWWTVQMAQRCGIRLVQRCIWYRNGWVPAGVSRKRLLQVHEWILWLTPTSEFNEPWEAVEGLVSTVFTQPWDRERLYETPYPVALVERWLAIWSRLGQTVWDPFLGSGTTLIAAEKLGRVCYGMEISEAYCEVAIQRWESFTGQKARIDG